MPKSHTTEAEIARKVCSHYANDPVFRNPNFNFELDIELFKKYFNPIIHAKPYCIYHGNPGQQDEYNMFFRLVKGKVVTWLRRKKSAKEQVTRKAQVPALFRSPQQGNIRVPTLMPISPNELKHTLDLDF